MKRNLTSFFHFSLTTFMCCTLIGCGIGYDKNGSASVSENETVVKDSSEKTEEVAEINNDVKTGIQDDTGTEKEELSTNYEEQIKSLFLEQKETEELFRSIILSNLQMASYIQYAV